MTLNVAKRAPCAQRQIFNTTPGHGDQRDIFQSDALLSPFLAICLNIHAHINADAPKA